jgi:hypothetical protein
MRNTFRIVAVFALAAAALPAQVTSSCNVKKPWFFAARRYYDPLIADPRAAHQNALPGFSKAVPFLIDTTDNLRLMWDIDVGAEMPILGWENGGHQAGRVPNGCTGMGLWFVVDFHMLEDLNDFSNPIINNDYRFGLMFKAQRGLSEASWLGFKAHAGHESTHLGDEYSLAAQRLYPTAFERINVSYEWLDAGISYERATVNNEMWTVRGGAITTLPFGNSYYSADPLDTGGRIVPESRNSVEPYAGVTYRRERVQLLKLWGWYASIDARLKNLYDYNKASADEAEERKPTINFLLGLAPRTAGALGGLGVTSPFVRAYYGVNPHGQFRNQADFWLYGVGIRLDR